MKKFTNENRNRYYGLRVGDIINCKAFGLDFKAEVIHLVTGDNNRVAVKKEDGSACEWVAEWSTIITKVEDRNEK